MARLVGMFVERTIGEIEITEINDEYILFSNGSKISYDHDQDCCEWNYADFEQLDDIARKTKFTLPLQFEGVEGSGFRFGNEPGKMFFVPCYSEQNGYYTSELNIYLDGRQVLHIDETDEKDY